MISCAVAVSVQKLLFPSMVRGNSANGKYLQGFKPYIYDLLDHRCQGR